MATIAMPHIGLGGHIRPAARLGDVLVRQGHRVLAWAPERYRELLAPTGVEFRAHEPLPVNGPFPNLIEFGAELAEACERCLGGLIEELLSEGAELVIHDVHVPWGRLAADFLGLPRIVSNPLFPSRESALARWSSAGMARVPGLAEALERAEASGRAIARTWRVELGSVADTVNSPSNRILSFTTEAVLAELPLPEGWTFVGPLMTPAPEARPASGPPLVYVAFGTFFNVRPEAFRLVLDALADEPVEVLVSAGGGSVAPEQLEPLPANTVVYEFVDSREVLSRSALHVTHAGGSSVHESLLAGVPMVCLPQGADQFAWAERVQRLGAGLVIEPDTKAIRQAARELVRDGRARDRAAELGRELAAYPGEAKLAAIVEHALDGVRPCHAQGTDSQ